MLHPQFDESTWATYNKLLPVSVRVAREKKFASLKLEVHQGPLRTWNNRQKSQNNNA